MNDDPAGFEQEDWYEPPVQENRARAALGAFGEGMGYLLGRLFTVGLNLAVLLGALVLVLWLIKSIWVRL